MKTISLCMIVKDEEDVLPRALSCVQELADEIIIVDTGSNDKTVEKAREFTDLIFNFSWQDDFSKARNFAFSKAKMDYQMWIDADDVILPEDVKKLIAWKDSESSPDVVMLRYHTEFDASGSPTFTYYRERLLKRSADFTWSGAVHEAITPRGQIEYLDAAILHRKERNPEPGRNLRIFEKLLSDGIELSPRETFYYARELYYTGCYCQAAEYFFNVINDASAWIENRIEACRMLYRVYLSLNQSKKAIDALLKSFSVAPPRAEICCDIGEYFFNIRDYNTAIFWYRLATTLPRSDNSGAFVLPDCYDFIPYLQLCVCYDRLGDIPNARLYHQKAASCKPTDPAVIHNEAYFSSF